MRNKKILVADDNESFRKGFVNYLNSQKGLSVVGEASDGYEALTLSTRLRPDIIMMDIAMPKIDGITSARMIKRKYPDINIVIVTMYDEEAYRKLMEKLPVDGFISKASLSADLFEVLKKIKVNRRHVN